MKRLTGAEIRETWIKFFEARGHKYIPGVSLIPQGDKSLLWVNAGVTGLKKYFDGSEIPPCRRIVNVQKSIRTNDIENVGHTARHHTFFEMLGNFSIGDYFRKEVIFWAVEILTSEKEGFGMDLDKLYMTYNPSDLDSYRLWQEAGVKKDHLIPLEGNYWQIGEGPCGPNTEVFYDRGEKYDPDHIGINLLADDMENDRYIEIWGIVFSQFNAVNGVERKDYKELPSKNIDTGSGLERIACILQETETNFETDLFMPIIEKTEEISGREYKEESKMSFRVIADHARCLTFALSDGAYFSNEGRGYVLRRIIRRASRYGKKLGINEPFMYRLVDTVIAMYRAFYPEIEEKSEFVKKMIKGEEERFLRTLSLGEATLAKMIEGSKTLSGKDAFLLYDTHGFPLDLTKEICEESGVKVDTEGFEARMEEQKSRARSARGEIESFHKQSKDLLSFLEKSTFDYERTTVTGKVIGCFIDGQKVERIDEEGDIIVDLTPFYAESGGQVSDGGKIEKEGVEGKVIAVGKAPSGAHLIKVHLLFGSLQVGDEITQTVDLRKRQLTARNHSATHLLHAAISHVLKEHVDQKGSYVDENYLRFDFSYLNKISPEELLEIEKEVNEKIAEGIEEKTLVLPIEEAKTLGAEMEFSEKYGETVRVVTFGDYSKEFCGGTHVRNSSDIGLFVIESESSVSAGTRRIEARTSLGATSFLLEKKKALELAKDSLGGVTDTLLAKSILSLKEDNASLKKTIEKLNDKLAAKESKALLNEVINVNGTSFFFKKIEGGRNEIIKFGDSLKSSLKDYLIFLVGSIGPAYPVVCFASGKAAEKLGANEALKLALPLLQGNGGGKKEMASGSAKDLGKLEEAKARLESELR